MAILKISKIVWNVFLYYKFFFNVYIKLKLYKILFNFFSCVNIYSSAYLKTIYKKNKQSLKNILPSWSVTDNIDKKFVEKKFEIN